MAMEMNPVYPDEMSLLDWDCLHLKCKRSKVENPGTKEGTKLLGIVCHDHKEIFYYDLFEKKTHP